MTVSYVALRDAETVCVNLVEQELREAILTDTEENFVVLASNNEEEI